MLLFSKKCFCFLLSLLFSATFAYFAAHVRFDNSVWLDNSNPHKQSKDNLYTEFDRGEDLVVAIELNEDFFQNKFISLFAKITERLEEGDGVKEVKNPLSATTIIQHKGIMQILSFEDALEKKIIPNLADYKRRFTDSEYYGRLLSKDYQKLALVIKIEAPLAEYNHFRRERILQEVRTVLGEDLKQYNWYFSGEVRLNHALVDYTQKDVFLLVPVVIALICVLLYFVYRHFLRLWITVYTAVSVLLLSIAMFVLRDYPLTTISIALPVLILVIAIADAIHIMNRWDELSQQNNANDLAVDKYSVLRQTIRETWLPCFITSITTSIGFGSFYFSELIPLRQFGEISVYVIMIAYILITSHIWFFLWLAPQRLQQKKMQQHRHLERFLGMCYHFAIRKRVALVILTFGLIAVGLHSLYFVRTETNFLDVFFKKNSQVYQDFEYIDEHLGGTGAVDILLDGKQQEVFKQIESLDMLKNAEELLLSYPQVNYMQSYLNPIRMIHKEFDKDLQKRSGIQTKLPQTNEQLAQEILFLEFSRGDSKTDVLSPYVDFDYSHSRIHLQTPNLTSSAAEKIRLFIQDKLLIPADQYRLTGTSIFFQTLGNYVIDTQLWSILFTLVIIWILFIMEFRFKLATIGMLANVLPILLTVAAIIYLDIPFDFATVLISSVCFGLCVDDTIHFLHFYHLQKKQTSDLELSIKNVVLVIGKPIVFTSVLFALGFIAFGISHLVILIKFGVFTLLGLIFAFVTNVIILPAFLRLFDKPES